MNKIDYEFYSLIKKLELMSKKEVYLNIKNRYLSLNEELRGNIETFLNSFNYWGKLDYINNNFEEIETIVNLLKNNLTDLVVFYQNLKDYKSKKILLAIIRNYYYYDFTMLHEVIDACYKHYFDPDLVKTTKDTVYVDVGSYIGDSVDDFLDTYLEEYKKIYGVSVMEEFSSRDLRLDDPEVREIRDEVAQGASYHFGDPHLNVATLAGLQRMLFKEYDRRHGLETGHPVASCISRNGFWQGK